MLRAIYAGGFGALLLICLCHSARITNSNGSKSTQITNSSEVTSRANNARCFTKLFGSEEDKRILLRNPDDVKFHLYPNSYDEKYEEEIKYDDVRSLSEAHFRPDFPLKIIIHGFTKDYKSEAVQRIKNAYLRRMAYSSYTPNPQTGYNVILVDWEPLGNPKSDHSGLFYRFAVRNVPVVGKRVGEFVHFLMRNGAVNSLDNVHIIGFSLGAHVAGNAGETLKKLTGQVPARVTGLDPAGPAFYSGLLFSHRHLDRTDASFVDVIHSNKGGMGIMQEIGHANFYPNGGGVIQPQCEEEYELRNSQALRIDKRRDIWDTKLLSLESCSHNKATEFFALSILRPDMIACKCKNYNDFKSGCQCSEMAVFGEFCDPRARGSFYLDI